MSPPRAGTVVIGQVVIAAEADRLVTAEAIGIADGRVVSAGTRDEVLDAARAGATRWTTGRRAVVPGLRDFHLHLVGMARARREVAAGRRRRHRRAGEPAARRRRAAADRCLAARAWLARARHDRSEPRDARPRCRRPPGAAVQPRRPLGVGLARRRCGAPAWTGRPRILPVDGWSASPMASCPACCARRRPTGGRPSPSG